MWPPLASPSFKYVGRTIQPDDLAILDWCGLTPLFSGEAEGKSLSENLDMRWRLARTLALPQCVQMAFFRHGRASVLASRVFG